MRRVDFVIPSLKAWRAKGWNIPEDAVPDTFEAQKISLSIEKWVLQQAYGKNDFLGKEHSYVVTMLTQKFIRELYASGRYPVGSVQTEERCVYDEINNSFRDAVYADTVFTGFIEQYILFSQREGQRIADSTLEQTDKLLWWLHHLNPLTYFWWWLRGKLGLHQKDLQEAEAWKKWLHDRHISRMV